MKLRHWLNLISVGAVSALLAFFAARWAVTTYAEPTCLQFGTTNQLTFIDYSLPDWSYQNRSPLASEGNCNFQRADHRARVVGLYSASGKRGVPFVVSFALRPDIIFMVSFFGVALALALVTRAVSPRSLSVRRAVN